MLKLTAVLLSLLLVSRLWGQSKIEIAAEPGWIEPTPVESSPRNDSTEDSRGIRYLLQETQYNIREEATYFHSAILIRTSAGLQTATQRSFTFDPVYQRLVFHRFRIIRDGTPIDRLERKNIRIMQRETSLEYDLYDGRLTALIVISDLRVGDIIEETYSKIGTNPIFSGHMYGFYYLQYSDDVDRIRHRLVAPAGKILFARYHNGASPFTKEHSGSDTVYTFDRRDVKALKVEDDVPGWYDPYPKAEFGDFRNWHDVALFAAALFKSPQTVSGELRAKINEIIHRSSDPQERVLTTLRFIQDEVRYFGYEFGEQSHRPADPSSVYQRRFGDCKDKSVLFCTMLRNMGIHAEPVLVNTRYGPVLDQFLPSVLVFDHVVAKVDLANGSRFFDPTIANQGGAYMTTSMPAYGKALVVDEATDSLQTIPADDFALPLVREMEKFSVPSFTDSVTLNVTSTYTGMVADQVRSLLASRSVSDVQKGYKEYYLRRYENLRVARMMRVEDDRERNALTMDESYVIPAFWKLSSDSLRLEGTIFAQAFIDRLQKPSSVRRTMPLGISHPVDLSYEIRAELPKPWEIADGSLVVEDSAFRFTYQSIWSGTELTMRYALRTSGDAVSPERMDEYVRNVGLALGKGSYVLYETRAEGARYPAWFVALSGILVMASVVVFVWAYRRSKDIPRPVPEMQDGVEQPISVEPPPPIRGWLIFPAFGLLINPILLLKVIINSILPLFSTVSWSRMTTPASGTYLPYYGSIIIFEFVANALLIVFGVITLLYFFRRRKIAVKYVIALLIANPVLGLADHLLVAWLLTGAGVSSDQAMTDIGRGVIGCAIWIPYFLTSQRVRETFLA